MATLTETFDYALAPLGYDERPAKTAKGFWRRFGDAIIASRQAAADREIRKHAALIRSIEAGARRRDLPF